MVNLDHKPRWERTLRQARVSLEPGEEMDVDKFQVEDRPPERFEWSLLSLPQGATAVYRDQRNERTLQIREYDTHFTIQMDAHHPKANPVRHLAQDAPAVAAGLAVLGGLYLATR